LIHGTYFHFAKKILDLAAGIDINLQNDHIEEMINRQVPILQVLRLLCLQSLVNGGLKQKIFEFFKKEILQVFMNIV
jgi:vacuolar protein sorting-associated protein 33A